MPRRIRAGSGGIVFHVLNRAVRHTRLFDQPGDYMAFERILAEAVQRSGVRLLAYCLMPNHWHLIIWPENDHHLSKCLHWLTMTHAIRWATARGSRGRGAVYQDRYRALPVETSTYFLTVCRYVERNPLRAGLVGKAEEWRWSSLWQRCNYCDTVPLGEWPILRSDDWLTLVNTPQTDAELRAVRGALVRGQPLGSDGWRDQIASQLGLEHALRPAGRPRKTNTGCGFL